MTDAEHSNKSGFNRRSFLKTTAASAAIAGAVSRASGAAIPSDQKLKVGFIGCGGRGTGAASQALNADDNIELYAMGEVFQERIDRSLDILNGRFEGQGKINCPAERQFVGMDAYQRVIDSGVDVVILTTTPGFRPLHLRAAVEAGKHIFAEKPMAVDVAGVRHVLETLEMAKEKQLSIVAGFCWRYHPNVVESYRQVLEEGLIGDVTSVYATYMSGYSKPHDEPSNRAPGMSDIEWQIANWYNYNWLGGSGLVEQAVHSVDKIGWVMGDQAPVSLRATGGLSRDQSGGNIFDHFHIAFEYPNNVWCHLGSRKTPDCFNENADYIRGTKGALRLSGSQGEIFDNDGNSIWKTPREDRENKIDMYQVEHDALFASIRSGEFINDGPRMINSSMMAIAGRMSAHTGEQYTWEDAMNADEDLFPNESSIDWSQDFEPQPVATPGVTEIPQLPEAEA